MAIRQDINQSSLPILADLVATLLSNDLAIYKYKFILQAK